jgi:hypothetical protein
VGSAESEQHTELERLEERVEPRRADAYDLLHRSFVALPAPDLLVLQLYARGYSVRQIGLVLAARDHAAGGAPEERDLTARGRDALDAAVRARGCATLDEAISDARRSSLIA